MSFKPDMNHKISIVGAGPAGIALALKLIKGGIKNVELISKGNDYGGLCLLSGCIPAEYLFSKPTATFENTQKWTQEISQEIEEFLKQSGVQLTKRQVQEVQGNQLLFSSGEKSAFDSCVLAMGRPFKEKNRLTDFWECQNEPVALCCNDEIQILALAQVLQKARCSVLILNSGAGSVFRSPSIQALLKLLEAGGIRLFNQVRDLVVNENKLEFTTPQGFHKTQARRLLNWERDDRSSLLVDGKIFDFKVAGASSTFQYNERDNLFVIGDQAGGMYATHAQFQADQLGQFLLGRKKMSQLDSISSADFPIRLHGDFTWAGTGDLNLVSEAQEWIEIPFSSLLWSKVHGAEGSLWYLPTADKTRVSSIHILHPMASELISTAHFLRKFSVTDPIWKSSTIHPSASEIFGQIAEQLETY